MGVRVPGGYGYRELSGVALLPLLLPLMQCGGRSGMYGGESEVTNGGSPRGGVANGGAVTHRGGTSSGGNAAQGGAWAAVGGANFGGQGVAGTMSDGGAAGDAGASGAGASGAGDGGASAGSAGEGAVGGIAGGDSGGVGGACAGDAAGAQCNDAVCGDGFTDLMQEDCDDGNTLDGDTCSSTCRVGAVALASGDFHTCALGANGVLKCWGYNGDCQLGAGSTATALGDNPGEMGLALPAVDLGSVGASEVLVGGMVYNCALLRNGDVKCWGSGENGVSLSGKRDTRGCDPNGMGDNLSTALLGTNAKLTQLVGGYRHVCGLTESGRVKCWGMNLGGQVGLGDFTGEVDIGATPETTGDALPFVPITGDGAPVARIGGGYAESCAIFPDGRAKCWGYNVRGELGIELSGVNNAFKGRVANEMGDNLPFLKFGAARTPRKIVGGTEHACALMNDGTVLCWGDGVGDAPGEMGDALTPVPLGTGRTAREISMGRIHQCVILDNGSVKCWGKSGLGQGDTRERVLPSDLGDNLPPIDLGTGRTALAISTGFGFSCALLDNHAVKCWGGNGDGVLGLGDVRSRGDAPGEMGDALPPVDLRF